MTFSIPSLPSADLASIGNITLPGTNLSPSALAANAANAASLTALPSATAITGALTPGGSGLPNLASLFAPLEASPIPIPGLAAIKTTILNAQANIGLNLSVIQTGVQNQIDTAVKTGAANLPDPNAVANTMATNIFKPLTGIASAISSTVSNGLQSIIAEVAKGPLGNPTAVAASVGSSFASSVGSLTSSADAQINAIVAPMKAGAMASMLSGPMGQLSSIKTIMGTLGVRTPDPFAVARNLNSNLPVPNIMPKGPYDASNLISTEPAGVKGPATADVQVTQKMVDYAIAQVKAQNLKVIAHYGGQTTYTAEVNQTLYDAWINGLLGSPGADIRTKRSALIDGSPDASKWTDDQNALDTSYNTMWKSFSTTDPSYLSYVADRDLRSAYKKYGYEIINAMYGHTSKYALTADCQKFLTDGGVA